MYFQNKMNLKNVNFQLENYLFTKQYKWSSKIVEVHNYSYTQKAYDVINKRNVNVKCIFNQYQKSINEIRYLKKLYFNPYCIKMHNFFFLPKNIVLIVTENYDNTLRSFLKTNGCLSEQLTYKILKQIVKAIYFLSKYNILQKKFTDANIILCTTTYKIKLKNFEIASQQKTNFVHQRKIFPTLFGPPEWFLKKKFVAESLNTWILGLLFYKMLYNKHPFKTPHQIMYFPCICLKKKISLPCLSLLKWCLVKKPQDRITLKEMTFHPWLTKKWI